MDGVDLTPVLRGQSRRVRDWLHFEHAPCYSKQQAFHAITDGRFKYIWRPLDGREHLFDLAEDAKEERDLVEHPARRSVLEKCWRELTERLAERPEGFSDGSQLIAGRPYPPLNRGTPPR